MTFNVIRKEIYYYMRRLSHFHDTVAESILERAAGRPQYDAIPGDEYLRIGDARIGEAQACIAPGTRLARDDLDELGIHVQPF